MLGSRLLARAAVCAICMGTPAGAAPKAAASSPGKAAPGAAAGKPGGKVSPALRKKASALFEEGFKALDAGDFATCEQKFEEAYRTVPMAVVLLKVAECRTRAGAYQGAVETLERYLEERPDAPDRAAVEGQIAEIKNRPGIVSVSSAPPGAAIWVDGEDTKRVTPADVDVSPGEHTVELRLRFHHAEERRLVVAFGSKRELEVSLTRAAPLAPPAAADPEGSSKESSGYRATPAFWIFAGGAVAAAGVGTAFGLMALDKHSVFEDRPTRDLYDDGKRDALIADVAFGVAAASAITAGVIFFSSSQSEKPETGRFTVAPTFGRSGGGVVGHVRF